jgi:hypothetical protein
MTQQEYLKTIQEKLKKDPLVPIPTLISEISSYKVLKISSYKLLISNCIKELSKNGDKNAQLWIETSRYRNSSKRFRYVLQILAYVYEHGLTVEDLKKMDLRESVDGYPNKSILSILKPKIRLKIKYKTLLNAKTVAIELVKICKKYSLTQEQINYACKEYKINSDIPQLSQISSV